MVSVIVAAHNEEALLAACLESILSNPPEDAPYEVIVVDDGSEDGTRGVACNVASADDRVRVISQTQSGKGAALNAAVRHSASAYYLVTDADCTVPSNWVRGMMDELCEADLVFGTYTLCGPGAACSWWERVQESKLRVKWGCGGRPFLAAVGASFGFARQLWEQVGGFTEHFTSEDRHFAVRAIRAGWRVRNAHADYARVRTGAPATYRSFFRQTLRWRDWRALQDVFRGRWPEWERVLGLGYTFGLSSGFMIWTTWSLLAGWWIGLILGVIMLLVVEGTTYLRPLLCLSSHKVDRKWVFYFFMWVLAMIPVRLCEVPYTLARVVREQKPIYTRSR